MSEPIVSDPPAQDSFPVILRRSLARKWQAFLDNSVPHTNARWLSLLGLCLLYCVRVYYAQGFYIVTYGLGIFLLNLFIGFLTPLEDADADGGPLLPTTETDEFKPFIRRLPEFKFWSVPLRSAFSASRRALAQTLFFSKQVFV